jgi:small subunit ribosomal protein S4e
MHQKRLSAPKTLKIPRKTDKWVIKTSPGPHDGRAMPLLILVRDFLGLADTGREARRIISAGKILVDGRVVKNYKFPVGLFDVVTIPEIEKSYRIVFDERGRYIPKETEEADKKIYKVIGKTLLKGGKIQLNLFDGTNILGSNEISTKDTLVLKIPEKEILNHIRFEEGALVMIIGGTHAGEIGRIKEYKVVRGSAPNLVTVEGETRDITTIEDYIFVVGDKEAEKPIIDLGV